MSDKHRKLHVFLEIEYDCEGSEHEYLFSVGSIEQAKSEFKKSDKFSYYEPLKYRNTIDDYHGVTVHLYTMAINDSGDLEYKNRLKYYPDIEYALDNATWEDIDNE